MKFSIFTNAGYWRGPMMCASAILLIFCGTPALAQSAESYREAVRLKPGFAPVQYNLGMSLLRMNESKSARAAFSEAHRLDPTLSAPASVAG